MFPHLDAATRTMDVRYDMDNPEHQLRPGMFATVTLKTVVADTPAFRSRRAASPRPSHEGHRVSLTVAEQENCPVTLRVPESMTADSGTLSTSSWGGGSSRTRYFAG